MSAREDGLIAADAVRDTGHTCGGRRKAMRWRSRQAVNFWLKWVMVVLAYVFLHAPLIVVIGASFNGGGEYAAIEFPPASPSIEWYFEIPMQQFEALGLSFALASLASLSAVIIGVPAALGLVRSNLPGKTLIGVVFRSPLQIPPWSAASPSCRCTIWSATPPASSRRAASSVWPSATSSLPSPMSSARSWLCCSGSITVWKRPP